MSLMQFQMLRLLGGTVERDDIRHLVTEARAAIAARNAADHIPNAQKPLDIPTYDGTGVTTHPSVVYFPDGWNGYKIWMVHTPYFNANNQLENPSIVASNDNIVWDEPAPNPVIPKPDGNIYQSDPHLVYRNDNLEIWFRRTEAGFSSFYRSISSDGINWSTPEPMFDDGTFMPIVSPAIEWDGEKYRMWAVEYLHPNERENTRLVYAESTDGKNWTTPRFLDIPWDVPGLYPWHLDAHSNNDGSVEMLIYARRLDSGVKDALLYTTSPDNLHWERPVRVLEPTDSRMRFDRVGLYRSAFVKVKGEYWVYYVGADSTGNHRIGLTRGQSMLTLGIDPNSDDVPVDVVIKPQNYLHADASYNEYPNDTIMIFEVTAEAGYPISSGVVLTYSLWTRLGYMYQWVYPVGDNSYYYYYRKLNPSGGGVWSAWRYHEEGRIRQSRPPLELPAITVPPGEVYTLEKTYPVIPVSASVVVTLRGTLPDGIIHSVSLDRQSALSFRFFNASDAPVEIPATTWNVAVIDQTRILAQ